MYLELSEQGGEKGIAEIFFSDATGEFIFNSFCNDLPLAVVEWLIAEARMSLP